MKTSKKNSGKKETFKVGNEMDYTLQEIITNFKNGDDEPLDGDEVEDLIDILRAKINLHEGNITEEEYEKLLNK